MKLVERWSRPVYNIQQHFAAEADVRHLSDLISRAHPFSAARMALPARLAAWPYLAEARLRSSLPSVRAAQRDEGMRQPEPEEQKRRKVRLVKGQDATLDDDEAGGVRARSSAFCLLPSARVLCSRRRRVAVCMESVA